jgi:hypothetical protein
LLSPTNRIYTQPSSSAQYIQHTLPIIAFALELKSSFSRDDIKTVGEVRQISDGLLQRDASGVSSREQNVR